MGAAISEIYSGVFSPDAVSYRKRHDLIDHDERMGVKVNDRLQTSNPDVYAVGDVASKYQFTHMADFVDLCNDCFLNRSWRSASRPSG